MFDAEASEGVRVVVVGWIDEVEGAGDGWFIDEGQSGDYCFSDHVL